MLLDRIRPQLPADYSEKTPEERQAIIQAQKNLLQLRRNLIELQAGIQKNEGLIEQNEAQKEEVLERLQADERKPTSEALPTHRRRHLAGRVTVYDAQIEHLYNLSTQYQYEIDLYLEIIEQTYGERLW